MRKLFLYITLGLLLSAKAYSEVIEKTFQFNCQSLFSGEVKVIVTLSIDDNTGSLKKGKATILNRNERYDYDNLIIDHSSVSVVDLFLDEVTFIQKDKNDIWGFKIARWGKEYELNKFMVGDYKTESPYIFPFDATDYLKCKKLY